jgi:hypothetical protein
MDQEDLLEIEFNIVDYSFYMYWRQCEVLWLSLALTQGFHSLTKAILVAN